MFRESLSLLLFLESAEVGLCGLFDQIGLFLSVGDVRFLESEDGPSLRLEGLIELGPLIVGEDEYRDLALDERCLEY